VHRSRARLVILAISALITIGIAVTGRKPREPVTGGKPLGYWFHELPVTRIGPTNTVITFQTLTLTGVFGGIYGSQRVRPNVSTAAIRDIGIDGVPFLMAKLNRSNLPFWLQIQQLGFWCRIKRPLFVNREAERVQALTGLLALPSLPESTIENLRKLRRNPNPTIAAAAAMILRGQNEESANRWIDQVP
jgi:hypothetical protein